MIAATSEDEIPRLKGLLDRGQANGIAGLRLLQPEQLREIEPHCAGLLGLLVPGTGITDYKAVCARYAEIIAAQGGTISTGTEVLSLVQQDAELIVETTRGAFSARNAINCAGLHSDRIGQPNSRPETRSQDYPVSR